MARTKSIASIETEITRINSELTKLQEKQEALSDRLLELQKQKKEHEAKQVMEAFQKSGKSLQELMTVYSDQQTPFARSFRSSITEGEIHPHGS